MNLNKAMDTEGKKGNKARHTKGEEINKAS
jgi:hypothetical protein